MDKEFTGTYYYSMDSKGRIPIPPKYREMLGDDFRVTKTPENCLSVFPIESWNKFSENYLSSGGILVDRVRRRLAASTIEGVKDTQGRLVLPLTTRKMANLEKEIAIIGNIDRFEIWDAEAWNREQEDIDNEMINKMTSKDGNE